MHETYIAKSQEPLISQCGFVDARPCVVYFESCTIKKQYETVKSIPDRRKESWHIKRKDPRAQAGILAQSAKLSHMQPKNSHLKQWKSCTFFLVASHTYAATNSYFFVSTLPQNHNLKPKLSSSVRVPCENRGFSSPLFPESHTWRTETRSAS